MAFCSAAQIPFCIQAVSADAAVNFCEVFKITSIKIMTSSFPYFYLHIAHEKNSFKDVKLKEISQSVTAAVRDDEETEVFLNYKTKLCL